MTHELPPFSEPIDLTSEDAICARLQEIELRMVTLRQEAYESRGKNDLIGAAFALRLINWAALLWEEYFLKLCKLVP